MTARIPAVPRRVPSVIERLIAPRPAVASAPPRMQARVHRTLAEVEATWRRLEPAACVYQSYTWVSAIVDRLVAGGAEFYVVEIAAAGTGEPLMLLPLVRRRRLGCLLIEWLDFGVCDYAAPLVAPGFEPRSDEMAEIWALARAALPRADLARISRIPHEFGERGNPLALLDGAGRMDIQAFGMPISGEAETLPVRLCSPSMAREIAANARRLARLGRLEFVEARSADECMAIFEVLVEQRRKRFEEAGRFNLLARDGVRQFYLDAALRSLAEGGPVRLFGVRLDGEWIACAYGLVGQGAFHGALLTMAGGEWRKYSPGLHIAAEILRWAGRSGLTYFDMTVGAMPYKKGFNAVARDLFQVLEPYSVRGALAVRFMSLRSAAKAALARRPGLFERLRRARQAMRRASAGLDRALAHRRVKRRSRSWLSNDRSVR